MIPKSFSRASRGILGADPAAIAVIESFQPYVGRSDPSGHPLWYLRELSNVDRHRLIRFASLVRTGMSIELPQPTTGTVHPVWADGAVEHGAILGKLYYSDPSPPGGEMRISMTFGVTISDIEPA